MKFDEFPFDEKLQKGVVDAGFSECTPVQAQSFRHYFDGKDLYAQSQTGTGKTAAFVLTGLQELIRRNQSAEEFSPDKKMLVLSPTRELAIQIEKEAKLLGVHLPLRMACFYGGVGYDSQKDHLEQGVQVIIGTPGRVIDLAKSGELELNKVEVMVLDEADRMLDMGFIDDVRWVMSKLPAKEQRRTMLYSATMTSRVGNLAWEFMKDIGEVLIEPEQVATEQIEQEIYHVSNNEKLRLLLSILKKEEPASVIIFTNTKSGALFLEEQLRSRNFSAKALIGDLPQVKRNRIVEQLKEGKINVLLATDIASRGLHVEDLSLVINYDLPDEAENYVHRIGRTARAGKEGKAVSLACERYVYNLSSIEEFIAKKIPVMWFDEELLVPAAEARVIRSSSRDEQGRSGRDQGRRGRSERGDRGRPSRSGNSRMRTDSRRTGFDEKRAENEFEAESTQSEIATGEKTGERRPNTGRKPRNNKGRKPSSGQRREFKSKEDRLRFYQDKYGEDFGVEAGATEGAEGSENRAACSGQAPSKRRSNQNSQRRGRNAQKGQEGAQEQGRQGQKARPSGEGKVKTANDQKKGKNTPRPAQEATRPAADNDKKQGFWSRLFGKKN